MKKTIYIILIVSFILSFLGVFQSFWLDEATTGIVVRNLNFKNIIFDFGRNDFHPPLYYLIVKVWSIFFGTSEIAIRFVSIIFSLLTVYFTYKLGKLIFNETVGVISALFLGIAPLQLYYSHEARMYSMASLFSVLAAFYFFKFLKSKKNNIFDLTVYAFVISILFLTDYVSIFILVSFFVILFFSKNKNSTRYLFVISHFLLLVTFLVWYPIFKNQIFSGLSVQNNNPIWWKVLGDISIKNILLFPVKFSVGRISWENNFIYLFFVLVISSIYLLNLLKSFDKKSKNIFVILLMSLLVGVVVSYFIPILLYFRFLFLLPFFYILVAYGLSKQKENLFIVLFSLIIILNFYFSLKYLFNVEYHREDWRLVSNYIRNFSNDKNLVIWLSNSQKEGLIYYKSDQYIKSVNDVNDSTEKILLSRYVYDIVDPNNEVLKIVEENFIKVKEHNFNGIIFYEYEKNSN